MSIFDTQRADGTGKGLLPILVFAAALAAAWLEIALLALLT